MSSAFVLAGVPNLGAAQVGMLRAPEEADVPPDLVVGTSVGAINGARLPARELLEGDSSRADELIVTARQHAAQWLLLRQGSTDAATGALALWHQHPLEPPPRSGNRCDRCWPTSGP